MAAVLLWWFVTVWNRPPATLGEAAWREAVRRHHMPASTRVITDDSLGPRPERPVPPVPPVQVETPVVDVDLPATQSPQTPAAPVVAAAPVRDAAWWGARMGAARGALARDRVLVSALESRVAALANDIAARDDPAQRAQLIEARQQALAELDRLTTQVTDGERAITAIEDEARKAGVPPGWIRPSGDLAIGDLAIWNRSPDRPIADHPMN